MSKEYKEGNLVQFFESLQSVKKKLYSNPAQNPVVSCLLASQFLGLDTNCYVTESLLSLLFVLSTCPFEYELPSQSFQSCCLKFDEFLAKNIHSQLFNFHDTRVFRFQSFLLKMF